MREPVFLPVPLDQHRFHQPSAFRLAISRRYIHVLAVQAFRAMIRISVPDDRNAAPLAEEVLLAPLEYFILGLRHYGNDKNSFVPVLYQEISPTDSRYLFPDKISLITHSSWQEYFLLAE